MKRPDWNALVPPGYDPVPELRAFAILSLSALVYSCSFFARLYNSYNSMFSLYQVPNGYEKRLDPGAMMPRFPTLLDGVFFLFWLPVLLALVYAVLHYAYHWQRSKSIYLMRRLPDGWLLHRRCLALPAAGLAITAALVLLLLGIFYAAYRLVTPAGCLPDHHWLNC